MEEGGEESEPNTAQLVEEDGEEGEPNTAQLQRIPSVHTLKK